MKLRMVLLVVLAVVPLLVFSGWLVVSQAREDREAISRGHVETARALALAVDRQMLTAIGTLEALAVSETLDRGDLGGFHRRAARVLATQADWLNIVLFDPAGAQAVNLRAPFGRPLPGADRLKDPDTFRTVLATRRPAVSNLLVGAITKRRLVTVKVPVLREGQVRYVLAAALDPAVLTRILVEQNIPSGIVGAIHDRNHVIVARTRFADRFVGQSVTGPMIQRSTDTPEGWFRNIGREGVPIYAAFSRSRLSGFTVVLVVPAEAVEARVRASLWIVGAVGLLLVAGGGALAAAFGRHVARGIRDLADAANAVGRGKTPSVALSSIPEVNEAAVAIVRAGRERRRAEQERDAVLQREHEARTGAEAANRAKDQFLAVLSHELRTPLNAILGWVQLLRSGRLDAAAEVHALSVIQRNVKQQAQLISDLLDVSRIISGKLTVERDLVDLAVVVHRALESLRPEAEAKRLRVVTTIPDRIPPVVGDTARLEQLVANLVSNAIKFTPEEGMVAVELRGVGETALIVVRDSGAGIAPEFMPHLFERFRQADSSSTRSHGGLGLGLAIVRHLTELHRGRVRAESGGPGQGATFTVELPVMAGDVAASTATLSSDASARRAPVALRGLRVLLVDDDPDTVEVMAVVLSHEGADVKCAVSAPQAREVLDAFSPDVLVCDIAMPGESGLEFMRKLRGRGDALARTPAVAITANARAEDRDRILAAGFGGYVAKPVDPETLVATVAAAATANLAPTD